VSATALNPEIRASTVVTSLEQQTSAHATGAAQPDLATLSDHLSLLRRWYYRPEKQRIGEVFFPKEDGSWPIRRILNAAARASLGEPKPVPEAPRSATSNTNRRSPLIHFHQRTYHQRT
jgi:excinuclease ABC subunit C